jgi:hypothetical protein
LKLRLFLIKGLLFGQSDQPKYSPFDINKDGKTTREENTEFFTQVEYLKKRDFQFNRLDHDADWVWSEKEIANQKYRPVSVDEVFSIRDKNADEYTSEEEHKADEAIEFKRIDKNKDGALTATEFTAPVFFKRIDADADDKIKEEEYLGFRTKQFRNRDDNADGVIDKEKNKI